MIFLWLCKLCSCESNQLCNNIFRFAKTLHNIADYLVTAKIANVGGIFNSSKCHRISCFFFFVTSYVSCYANKYFKYLEISNKTTHFFHI